MNINSQKGESPLSLMIVLLVISLPMVALAQSVSVNIHADAGLYANCVAVAPADKDAPTESLSKHVASINNMLSTSC